jgi:hypothetical protein
VQRFGGRGSLRSVEWGFLWIMFALKIPLIALLWLVWWAIKNVDEPEPDTSGEDGGTKVPPRPHPRRRPRWPRHRGPHGAPPLPPPPRVRTTVARGRDCEHA